MLRRAHKTMVRRKIYTCTRTSFAYARRRRQSQSFPIVVWILRLLFQATAAVVLLKSSPSACELKHDRVVKAKPTKRRSAPAQKKWSDWIQNRLNDVYHHTLQQLQFMQAQPPLTTPQKSTLTDLEVALLRVRDIKWHLARRHGFGADEIGHMLDKKELVQALINEEEKVRRRNETEYCRLRILSSLFYTVIAMGVVLCWPLLRYAYGILSVNAVVYTDRKRYEFSLCRQYHSCAAGFGFLTCLVLDIIQLWLSTSVVLSWFVGKNRFSFPMPYVPVRPGLCMGEEFAKSSLGGYGINIGPMIVTWMIRYAHGWIERRTGQCLVRAKQHWQRHKKQHRATNIDTPIERRERKHDPKQNQKPQHVIIDDEDTMASRCTGRNYCASLPLDSDIKRPYRQVIVSDAHQQFLQQLEEHTSPLHDLD